MTAQPLLFDIELYILYVLLESSAPQLSTVRSKTQTFWEKERELVGS